MLAWAPEAHLKYTYDNPRPAVTVDCVLFSGGPRGLQVLLIQRGGAPFAGRWAFPGGFVEKDEDLKDAALRELQEETGLELDAAAVQQVGTFGAPGRDPRGHTVSVVYSALVPAGLEAQGADDAKDARWFDARRPPTLAFDHREILKIAVARLRRDAENAPIGLHALPRTFALDDLRSLYESVLGVPIDAPSLRRSLSAAGLLVAARGGLRFDRRRYAQLEREGVMLEVVG